MDHSEAIPTQSLPRPRLVGRGDGPGDAPCCGWCGEVSDTDICAACQRRFQEDAGRPTPRVVTVDTRRYVALHQHEPRQSLHFRTSRWFFTIDDDPAWICIQASYLDALREAQARAQYRVTVCP